MHACSLSETGVTFQQLGWVCGLVCQGQDSPLHCGHVPGICVCIAALVMCVHSMIGRSYVAYVPQCCLLAHDYGFHYSAHPLGRH